MNRPEAVACLRLSLGDHADGMTREELDGLAERLADDPILLALFGRMLRDHPQTNPYRLAEDVIGRFTGASIGELAARHSRPQECYEAALMRVSQEMIRRKVLYPAWDDLQIWLRSEQASFDAISQLAAQGHLCRLTARSGASRFEFRHDRILEHHVAAAMANMLSREDSDRLAVSDPFFTQILGRAIARFSPSEPTLDWVLGHSPNSLIAAIPYLPTSASAYADTVVAKAKNWLSQSQCGPASRRWDAVRSLAESSSPRVLEVTAGLPEDIWLLYARFRNGDAVAGSRSFVLHPRFSPAVRDAWLETLVDQAKAHHGARLIADLRSLLTTDGQDDSIRAGGLILAGYLGDSCLADAVRSAWEKMSDRQAILLMALWAGLRCSGEAAASVLGRMMPLILELPDEKSQRGLSERGSLVQELGFTTRYRIGEPVLSYLADLGSKDEAYQWIVTALLDNVDHPLAIAYIVPTLARRQHEAEQSGRFFPWAMTWGDRWRRRCEKAGPPLSDSSLAELRRIWESADSPDWLLDFAFGHWSEYVRDLDALRSIPSTSRHFEQAVWQRALRGDKQVVPHVVMKLANQRRWLDVVPPIWSPEFGLIIDGLLGEVATDPEAQQHPWADAHFMLSHLLRDIPPASAEGLLTKHWEGLRRAPLYIQVALYLGTEQCTVLAEQSLRGMDAGNDPFQHIESVFGFFASGLMDRLTIRHIEVLLPYVHRLDDMCIDHIVNFCCRYGHWEWAVRHLKPECRRRVEAARPDQGGEPSAMVRITRHWFPTDEELMGELNQFERENPRYLEGRIRFWWERSIERSDPPGRLGALLGQWLRQSPSLTRFKVVAIALRGRGTRQDLVILREQQVDADADQVNAVMADVEFAVMRRSLN